MVPKVRTHGGIALPDLNSELTNAYLEQREDTPVLSKPGHLWFDNIAARVAYTQEASGTVPSVVQRIATVDDVDDIIRESVSNMTLFVMVFGQVVYGISAGSVGHARSDQDDKKDVVGFVCDDSIASMGGFGKIQTSGLMKGSVAQWEVATGLVGGLVPNKRYFLDVVAGQLTFTPNMESGYLCPIGRALTTTNFLIDIERPVRLYRKRHGRETFL